jgi:uncharacterized protein (DUF2267 family)
MRHDEFVRRVEAVAAGGLEQHAAEPAITATLTTLGTRLGRDHARTLAAQLPVPLQPALRQASGPPGIFGEREFLRRVAVALRLAPSAAFDQTRAVLHVLQEAVSDGERARLRRALASDCPTLLRPPAAANRPQAHESPR